MQTRIERRRARVGRWLLYPLIALSATALAGLAIASPSAKSTTYRVIPLSPSAFSGVINARGQVAFTDSTGPGTTRAMFYDGSTVRDIGTLGGPSASAVALNDLGQVTGGATIAPDGIVSHAYRWSLATGMVDLSRPGMGNSIGFDINEKGHVAGTAVFDLAGGELARAFRWTPATGMRDLGSFGGISFGSALNDAGTVVGESEVDNGGPLSQTAFRWTQAAGIQPFGTLPSRFTVANDIDEAGRIVGATPFALNEIPHAYLWTQGAGLLDLTPGRPERTGATRINAKGLVIGNVIDIFVTFHGFIWSREGGLVELGAGLPEVDTSAVGLNNRGQVVGSVDNRAILWTRSEGIVDLNTRIPHAPAGLVLIEGRDINDSGAIVARANTGLVLLVPYTAHSGAAPVAGPVKLHGSPRVHAPLSFSTTFKDADLRDTHKATWTWGDGSKEAGTVNAKNGAGSVSGQHAYRKPGIYTVKLTIVDSSGKSTTVQRTVAVCGSGAALASQGSFMSPPGALATERNLSGLANFAFILEAAPNARQAKAALLFDAPGAALRSDTEVTVQRDGARVEYTGSGTLNGKAKVQFSLSTVDGQGSSKDRIRMRIWHHGPGNRGEVVAYDNGAVAGGSAGGTAAKADLRGAGSVIVDGTVTGSTR